MSKNTTSREKKSHLTPEEKTKFLSVYTESGNFHSACKAIKKERFEVEEDIREDENFAQRYQDAYANYLDDIEYTIRLRTFESGNSALFMTVYKAAESRRLKSNKAEDAANTALKSTKGASDKELRDLALAAARRKGRILDTEEDDDTD